MKLVCALPFAIAACSGVATAATLGFHDSSDPAKSIGWACSTTGAVPVRVHLYADVDGALVRVDTQIADKRRDDLAIVCAGTAHAFRFADYAATSDGLKLYSRTAPVSLHVFAETPEGPQRLNGSPRSVSFAPVGLWDPGLDDGRWRTDLDNPLEGTAAAPLLLGDCAFTTPLSDGYPAFSGGGPDVQTHCRYGHIVSPQSNAASSEPPGSRWPRDAFWVITANVEPALDNPHCANGPPGQSLPIQAPGTGSLFGVVALADGESAVPSRKKMHLVLNSWNTANCRMQSYAIPYLAFGTQADRGNGGVIAYLNTPGLQRTLSFAMTLMDSADANPAFGAMAPGTTRYRQAHLLIEAAWGGKKRWLFIELLPDAREAGGPGIDAHVRFNWHMVGSFIHPGADYVFKSAAVITAQCQSEGVSIPALDPARVYSNPATRSEARTAYAIDVQKLFECLNRTGTWGAQPMPSHAIPVTGIHFGIEMDDRLYREGLFTGALAPNALWIAVDSVSIETIGSAMIQVPLPLTYP